jgi:8-amino-7-oxononanoate synthase
VDFSSNDYLGLSRHSSLHRDFIDALSAPPSAYSTTSLFDQFTETEVASTFNPLTCTSESLPTSSYPISADAHSVPKSSSSPSRVDCYQLGSTGSRLLTGNSPVALALESDLARFHRSESALLFNSGYDANVGLFSTLPPVGSSVIYDDLIHASVHDGLKICRAKSIRSFKHNDLGDFKRIVMEEVERIESKSKIDGTIGLVAQGSRVNNQKGTDAPGIIVAVESIYSMDGDEAPLVEMVKFIERIGERAGGVYIVVDEAHSTGIRGHQGRGLVSKLGLESKIFARLHTFGKAVGAHGGNYFPRHLIHHLTSSFGLFSCRARTFCP